MNGIIKQMIDLVTGRFGRKKTIAILGLLVVVGVWCWRALSRKSQEPQYKTAQAERGTLVTTVSASGDVIGGNGSPITTSATGVVSAVYVKNGDKVTAGHRLAEVTLDSDGQQRQASAWSSYLSATNQLAAAQANLNTLQAAEFKANQTFMNDAVARGLVTSDPTYIQENASWLAAEANYKNQINVIAQLQAAVTSAWYSYRQSSSTVLAPATGVVGDLAIASGVPLVESGSSSTTGSVSSQKVGTVGLPEGRVVVSVSIAEIDSSKVSAGQRATLTLDAFPGRTFTGKVLALDTSGVVSSGVTTYPAMIAMDTSDGKIYPNMAVDAKIITSIKDNVVLVLSGAVQTSGGQSAVRLLEEGQIKTVVVEVGEANDTQTEITSGLSGGETVVTGVTVTTSGSQQGGGSPFSAFGSRGLGGGGAVFRMQGR